MMATKHGGYYFVITKSLKTISVLIIPVTIQSGYAFAQRYDRIDNQFKGTSVLCKIRILSS